MADLHKNFAYSLVATAPSPATSGTSLVVTAADGAIFPTVPFQAVIWQTGVQPLAANAEIVTVTAISTDTLTIVRAQEGSVARTVVIGDQIAAVITNQTLKNLEQDRLPTYDETIQAGFSSIRVGDHEIASGNILDILSNGILEIT